MTQTYILGGYTKRENKGISTIHFDAQTATFDTPELIAELNGPTFVGLNKDKTLAFAINKEGDQGGIVAFKKEDNGQWTPLASAYGPNGTGCHVSYREASKTVYVANYHGGLFEVYQLEGDNLKLIQTVQHHGSSVHPNQTSSHVHFAGLNADESLLFVCDLGTDKVATYNVKDDGTVALASELTVPAGTGPRHLTLHPSEPYAYIVGELNSTTIVASLDAAGTLAIVETHTNIPEEKVEESAGAAIRLTKDGNFLYVSNRFYNVLTVFNVSEDGAHLTKIQEIDTHGEIPRDFILDESEQFVLVAHQDSDYLSVFSRDAATGELNFVNNDTKAAETVCITHA